MHDWIRLAHAIGIAGDFDLWLTAVSLACFVIMLAVILWRTWKAEWPSVTDLEWAEFAAAHADADLTGVPED